jgi:hypothetical protein
MHDVPAQPWYRQFWPWFIFSLPAASVVAGFTTLYLAGSAPAMVVDDYGRIAKTTAQRIERRDYARQLGLSAALRFADSGELYIDLTRVRHESPWPAALTLQLVHPTQAERDQIVVLEGSGGRYATSLVRPAGRYYLALTDHEGNWRLAGELPRNTDAILISAAPES